MMPFVWRMDLSRASDPVEDALRRLLAAGLINDLSAARQAIASREDDSPTYVGNGIAMPHIVGAAAAGTAIVLAPCGDLLWAGQSTSLLVFVITPDVCEELDKQPLQFMQELARLCLNADTPADARLNALQYAVKAEATEIS